MQQTALAAPAEPGIALPRPTLTWVARAAAFALGLVLLVATFAKALDPQSFAEMLQSQGLTFGLPPMAAAVLALAVEGGLGLLLVLGVRRRWSLSAVTLLVVGFVALNGWEWWRAAHGAAPAAGCGCFGNLVQRSPAAAFWQDLAMLVPLLLLSWLALPRGSRALPPRRTAAVAVGIAAIALLAWRAPALPLDDLATRLKPGVELSQLCAGEEPRVCLTDVAPEAASGRAWVVLVDLKDAEHWADALNAFAGREGGPPVVALTDATLEEKTAFTWQWGPTFPVHEAPTPLLRPLYRSLPRSFLAEDGRVLRTVPGLPAADVPGDSKR
jgi:uncharacterized membrane protein YphA (DoxX/SURF4 family)